MMNCFEVITEMDYFIDGELPFKRMQSVSQHLTDCPGCDEKYKAELRFREAVKTKLPKRCCTESLMNNVREVVMQNTVN